MQPSKAGRIARDANRPHTVNPHRFASDNAIEWYDGWAERAWEIANPSDDEDRSAMIPDKRMEEFREIANSFGPDSRKPNRKAFQAIHSLLNGLDDDRKELADLQDTVATVNTRELQAKAERSRSVDISAQIHYKLRTELADLQAIVDKLPKINRFVNGKFMQDVPIYLAMVVYRNRTDVAEECTVRALSVRHERLAEVQHQHGYSMESVSNLYDTKEAAQAARGEV